VIAMLKSPRVGIIAGRTDLNTSMEWDPEEIAVTHEQRSGRCYELCAIAVAFGTAGPDSVLVHGTIHGPDDDMERIGHAWVLLGNGMVWEPLTMNLYISEANWTEFAAAIPERKYGPGRVRRLLKETDNFGPWHETEGATKKAED
jgi:hypothetical protein